MCIKRSKLTLGNYLSLWKNKKIYFSFLIKFILGVGIKALRRLHKLFISSVVTRQNISYFYRMYNCTFFQHKFPGSDFIKFYKTDLYRFQTSCYHATSSNNFIKSRDRITLMENSLVSFQFPPEVNNNYHNEFHQIEPISYLHQSL